jgi:glycosyltransferase involved in cell wall biosynthesis
MENQLFNSVIISAYNEEENIFKCLKSVEKAILNIENVEVIVINNGSNDSTPLKIKEFTEQCSKFFCNVIKTFDIKHVGLSEARNFGISEATGNYLSFVDADAIVDIHWLNEINLAFSKYQVDIISGRVNNLDNGKFISTFLFNAHYGLINLKKKTKINHDKFSTSVIGANMTFKKEIFNKTSGFFDQFLYRGDDTSFVTYLKTLGYKELYLNESIVFNDHTDSLYNWFSQQYKGGIANGIIKNTFRTLNVTKAVYYLIFLLLLITIPIFWLPFFGLIFIFIVRFLYSYDFLYSSFLNVYLNHSLLLALSVFPLHFLGFLLTDLGTIYSLVSFKKIKF